MDSAQSSRRDMVRDPALTAMLIVQCLIIFVAGPFIAAGYPGSRLLMELASLVFAVLVILASRGRITTRIAALATLLALAGSSLSFLFPTTLFAILVHIGTLGSFGVVGYAAFSGPMGCRGLT